MQSRGIADLDIGYNAMFRSGGDMWLKSQNVERKMHVLKEETFLHGCRSYLCFSLDALHRIVHWK